MDKQIIITKWDEGVTSFVLDEDGNVVAANVESAPSEGLLGNVYIGQVKNIVENIGAAFVEIADGTLCYLSLSERGEPIYVNDKKGAKRLKPGDELFVQVSREDARSKQPVVTHNVSLTGKYAVLVKDGNNIFLSSKISDKETRQRLLELTKGRAKDGYGFVLRTNAALATDEQIMGEMDALVDRFEKLCREGVHRTCFSCLYQAPSSFLCGIRDANQQELQRIVTDDEAIHGQIQTYLKENQREDLDKLHLYQDKAVSINVLYGLRAQIDKALMRKVWLKSGGNVLIEYTEACTVIDVNTEKAIRGGKKGQGVYRKVNREAAEEIARQLRLRNLSGIIIVDFIDMDAKEHRIELMDQLRELVAKDPVQTDVVDMTKLGLVELTRKKIRKPLYEQMRHR